MPEAFGLCLVLTDPVAGYAVCARAAVRAGVRYVQLRMKGAEPARLLDTALELRAITRGTGTRFIVNDDVAAARAAGADGVHLGQEDVPVERARADWADPGALFGLSTHNETQVRAALKRMPSYIGIGPVFATPTKANPDPVLGLDEMERLLRLAFPLTTVVIGGIDAENLPRILSRGAVNVAVVRAVCRASDPARAIDDLQGAWRRHANRLERLAISHRSR